ncbi:hypothetical protein ACTQZS_08040 [Bilifractor sp. LCP19S3_H10]|uniref:hypothetical protein n=1 Tax=Bilifractor sp. LCP19S3_H10 TaxID=3438736 RepID=UPI003F8EC8AB
MGKAKFISQIAIIAISGISIFSGCGSPAASKSESNVDLSVKPESSIESSSSLEEESVYSAIVDSSSGPDKSIAVKKPESTKAHEDEKTTPAPKPTKTASNAEVDKEMTSPTPTVTKAAETIERNESAEPNSAVTQQNTAAVGDDVPQNVKAANQIMESNPYYSQEDLINALVEEGYTKDDAVYASENCDYMWVNVWDGSVSATSE